MAKSINEYRQEQERKLNEARLKNNALLNYIQEPAKSSAKEEAKASSGGFDFGDYIAEAMQYAKAGPVGVGLLAGLTKPLWEDAVSDNFLNKLDNYVDRKTFLGRKMDEGVYKSIEGIVDLGAGLVGGVGGLISDDFRAGVKDFIATDHVGEWYNRDAYKHTENGIFKDDGLVAQGAEAVGGMLPSVLVAIATGGGSVAAQGAAKGVGALAKAAPLLTTATGAAGNATESAYQDGAGYYGGLAYGAAIGGLEAATEKLVGGGLEKAFGGGWLDDIIPIGDWAKTGVGRYVANAAGEGVEEIVSEAVDPLAKAIYKGKDAFTEYDFGEHMKNIGKAGLMGAAVSGVYGGAFDVMAGGVKAGDVDSLMRDVSAAETKGQNLQDSGKLDDATREKLKSQTLGDLQTVEKILKSLPESKRAEIIESRQLSDRFNADGSLKAGYAKSYTSGDAELDTRYYSYSERGHEDAIKGDIAALNGELEVRFGDKAQKVGVYNGDLTEKGKASQVKTQKALSALNKISGRKIGLVITDASDLFNGKLVDDKRIYMTADTLENGTWAGTLVHEYTHFEEGTKEYNELVELLESDADFSESVSKVVLNKKAYGFDAEAIKAIRAKVASGKELSREERWAYEEYRSELEAHMSEAVLGTENFIDKVIRTDASLAEKILGKIGELKAAFERIGDPEARAQHKRLAEAERLYLKAAEAAGYKYQSGKMVSVDEEEEKEKTAEGGGKYDLKDIEAPTYEELVKKDPIRVIDISEPQTQGTFKERRKSIVENAEELIKRPYLNKDTDTLIFLSNSSYTHTFNNLGDFQLNMAEQLPKIIENAIFTHKEPATHGNSHVAGVYTFFAAVKDANFTYPVKLKVKEHIYSGQELPKNIKEYFENNPEDYYATYDAKVLEVEEIEESPSGSANKAHQDAYFLDPNGLPMISISDLLELVKGDAEKYIPRKMEKAQFSFKEDSDNNKNITSNNENKPADNKKSNSYTKATNEKLSAKERKLVERLDKAEEKAKEERQKREDAERYNKTANRVLKLVRDINNWKKGVFESAAEANGDVFKGIIGGLSKIDIRGNVSPIAARKAMQKLADWYGAADLYPIVQELKEAEIWSEDALKAMQSIGDVKSIEAQKPLSVAELQNIETVIRHLKHIVETYHRVFRAGKYIDARPLAENYIRIIGENAKINVWRMSKLIDGKYYEYFGDTESLMKWHDRYNKDGFFTATFNELREGSLNMAIAQMKMRAELDAWLDKNPNFLKKLNNTTIEVEGIKMTRAEALSLYMTARREQAEGGLAVGGFEVKDAKSGEKIGVDGLVDKEMASANSYTKADLEENAKAVVRSKEVAQLTGHEFERTGDEKLSDKVVEFFNSIGNVAYNKELGKIALTKSSFRDDKAHGLTRNKVISFRAVPDVIEKGHIIDVYKPEGKPYERITIAAPVKIGTQKYYVGVMVQRDTQSQRMYLHDIIAEEATLSFTTEPTTQKSEGIRDEGHLFITSILQKALSVKSETKKTSDSTYDMEKMIGLVGRFKDHLFEQFDESEKQYLGFVEKILNEDCKARKERTDNIRLGYSNTLDGFYYPIRRGHVAYKVGEDTLGAELGRIKSLSFNKDTVKGSKGRLFIEPINNVVDRHIAGIAMYENLSIAIDNFNRLFNIDIGGNKNNPVTIAKAMEKEGGWAEAGKYIDKLIKDIEGIKSADKWESKALGFIRSGFVKFQLGANPKTWVTQLSSLFASMSVLNPQHVAKAMAYTGTHSKAYAEDLDNHSALAKLRNTENTAALSQGVVDQLGKVGDVLMKPIGMTDRFVIKKLWYACQLQVEAEQKLKLGSEANKVAAAKLLEKVIFETQQNSLLTERSAAMRSSSELIKGFTMFSSDAMKLTARIVDAYGRINVIKEKLKTAEGDAKKALEAELKEATGEFARASGSAVAVAVFMSLIAMAFSHLYGKRDDDEKFAEAAATFGADFAGNLLGGLPLIRDVYSYIADGYELNHYAISYVNDLLSGVNGLFTLTNAVITGKRVTAQEVASKTKAALFGLGQVFGIPLRNAYNVGRGLVGGASLITGNGKSFGYAWDSLFYDKNYRSDLGKAIEAGDDKLVARISSLMVGESFDGVDKSVADELRRLVGTGADVLPRAVGDSVTYDGEEYAFTLRQRNQFEKIYGIADEALADMVKLKQYKAADDAVKARAVKFIYETYYGLAVDDMLGVDSSAKNVLFAEAIDIEKLAIIVAQARMITADKDKNGKPINGTRKLKLVKFIESLSLKAAEKHMLLGFLGYRQKAGEEKVKAYINRLKLTSAEKKALLEFSGYKAA